MGKIVYYLIMKKIVFSTLLLTALALSSCTFIQILPGSSSSASIPTPTSKKDPVIINSTYENYVKNSVYYESVIPTSVKKSKYLVLPVWFNDSPALIKPGETKESILGKVTTAFGGTTEETGWHSVKSFYETESKGKKEFDVVIADWYDCGFASDCVAGSQNDEEVGKDTEVIIASAINNYFETHDDNREDYDSDGDGYLDAIAVVYAIQNYKSDFDFARYYRTRPSASFDNLWAYVYWFQDPDNQNVNNPGPNAYLWASYDFVNVNDGVPSEYPVKVDAHCYIHESGHLFGLDDYYDYTENSNRPAGGFSMQDYNVGGHDPFSVVSLGWGEVYAPTQTETIEISPFATSNQVVLLSPSFEDSIFDEYLLLEFYTPTGLNELDCTYLYQSGYPQGPKVPGIRLWHVDARLAYKEERGYDYPYSPSQITNKIDTQYYYNMLCRNNTYNGTPGDYFSPLAGEYNFAKYRLLELIRNEDYFKLRSKSYLSGEDLFVAGSSFNMNDYSKWFVERGKMNSGRDLGWSFTVNAITSESANITITKL